MSTWLNDWIGGLVELTGLTGLSIVLVTIPLAIIQGFLGLFPFSTLIFIHVYALGVQQGLLISWLAGTLSAVIVYLVCKYLFAERFRRRWGHKLERYDRWQLAFDRYGIWAIIFLRTLPVMPNNLISFMSAISPIRFSAYVWSSILGNLSHIWLFGILSSSLLFPDTRTLLLIGSYLIFCFVLLIIFAIFVLRGKRTGIPGSNGTHYDEKSV